MLISYEAVPEIKLTYSSPVSTIDCFRQTAGYSGSDLTSLAKDAALGPIRGNAALVSCNYLHFYLQKVLLYLVLFGMNFLCC